jgi:hypothetical protein
MLILAMLACTGPEGRVGDPSDTDPSDTDTGAEPQLTDEIGICDIWQADALYTTADLAADLGALDEMVELGVGLGRPHRTRGHAFAWSIVQKGGPDVPFDWTLPDYVVAESQAKGVDLMVTIYPFAEQVRLDEAPNGLVPLVMPADEEGWRVFVRAMAERYDGDGTDDMPGLLRPVRYWEIGNEHNCAAGDELCYGWLLDLVRTSHEEIHAAQADAVVIPAGAAPTLPGGSLETDTTAMYRWFVDNGGLAYTDAFSFHMATGNTDPTLDAYVGHWRGIVGEDVPMWLGEVASRSLYDGVIVHRDDPQAEADWLVDQFRGAEELGLEKAFWCRTGGPLDRAPLAYDAMKDWIAAQDSR